MAKLKSIEARGGTWLLRGVGKAASRCPDRYVKPFGKAIGRFTWHVSRRYREVALRNLRFAFSAEKSDAEIVDLARRVFEHFGRVLVEFFWAQRLSDEDLRRLVRLHNIDEIRRALEAGNGGIIITAHFGNWELMARRLVVEGLPVSVIARDSDDPGQTGLVNAIRESAGYNVISRGEPASRLLSVLRANELLGILPDQNTAEKPIFVPFFGKLASAAPGVGLLALRSGCPVIPGFSVRENGCWRVEILRALTPPPDGDLKQRITSITAAYTKTIEDYVRRYPEHWLWFHDRWRRRPDDEV